MESGEKSEQIEEILHGDNGPTADEEALDKLEQDMRDGFDCNSIEVPGIMKDDQGHTWAIPAEGLTDRDDLGELNPFGKLNYDPRFHYQMEHQDRVSQKMTEGFVPVTRQEVGVPPPVELEYGKPISDVLHLMDTVLMKIPRVLADRLQSRKARVAKSVIDATEPSREMLRRAGRNKSKFKNNQNLTEAAEAAGFSMNVERKSRKSAALTR